MIKVHGYAAEQAKAPLGPYTFERRNPGENDVVIDIQYCGVCHTDIHQVNDEWGEDQPILWFQDMRSQV
jgi:alcohol dehydrogenase (NADP+)